MYRAVSIALIILITGAGLSLSAQDWDIDSITVLSAPDLAFPDGPNIHLEFELSYALIPPPSPTVEFWLSQTASLGDPSAIMIGTQGGDSGVNQVWVGAPYTGLNPANGVFYLGIRLVNWGDHAFDGAHPISFATVPDLVANSITPGSQLLRNVATNIGYDTTNIGAPLNFPSSYNCDIWLSTDAVLDGGDLQLRRSRRLAAAARPRSPFLRRPQPEPTA